jgi:hypothetical protein
VPEPSGTGKKLYSTISSIRMFEKHISGGSIQSIDRTANRCNVSRVVDPTCELLWLQLWIRVTECFHKIRHSIRCVETSGSNGLAEWCKLSCLLVWVLSRYRPLKFMLESHLLISEKLRGQNMNKRLHKFLFENCRSALPCYCP